MDLAEAKALYAISKESALKEWMAFLSIPSISSSLNHLEDVKACCSWLSSWMKEHGLPNEIWETAGHPALFASLRGEREEAPTLLLYGHYDVQPVDPLNLWTSPPFQPEIREGEMYARGAEDNKGQLFYTLSALAALIKKKGKLPIHVKLLIEGEEEVGSPSLPEWLEKNKEKLKADYIAIVDTGLRSKERAAITLGARGIVTMDLTVQGTKGDLHSGSHGGLAYNPLIALAEILAKLHDPNSGKVTVPHFYDKVVTLSKEEKALFSLDFDTAEYATLFGSDPTGGEKEFSPAERLGLRPTLEINGISGGFSGPGFKTVIPAKAEAKLSCRLVPDQDPDEIGALLKKAIEESAPPGISVQVHLHPGVGRPLRASPHSKCAAAFSKAYEILYGGTASKLLEGGSIPISAKLQEAAGGELLFVGLGLPDDNIHAPNEHFSLKRFEEGFLSICLALHHF